MITDNRKTENKLPAYLKSSLPEQVVQEAEDTAGELEEIRLRVGRFTEYKTSSGSRRGKYVPDRTSMDEILFFLCGGSVYAHGETLCQGYIRGENGVRIGVVGHAVCQGSTITALQNVTSLNIRIPVRLLRLSGAGTPYPELADAAFGGLLICSPPGVGKTTALRYTARFLAGTGHRVAVIDSRGELAYGLEAPGLTVDVLDGYPRASGIEIALRTMCPDFIVCDEIGNADECDALMSSVGAGVSVVATAHAQDSESAQRRQGIDRLCRQGVFSSVAFLSRNGNGHCHCTVNGVTLRDI